MSRLPICRTVRSGYYIHYCKYLLQIRQPKSCLWTAHNSVHCVHEPDCPPCPRAPSVPQARLDPRDHHHQPILGRAWPMLGMRRRTVNDSRPPTPTPTTAGISKCLLHHLRYASEPGLRTGLTASQRSLRIAHPASINIHFIIIGDLGGPDSRCEMDQSELRIPF